jgi:hypothetical protein
MPAMTRLLLAFAAAITIVVPTHARVAKVTVSSATPAATGQGAIPYEILRGTFFGELDPRDPHNAAITDIMLAPRNPAGKVEYSATFQIARPIDPGRSSGVLIYDVPNRGLGSVAGDPAGHIRVISGWQGDIVPARGMQTATVPVAQGPGGRPITGLALVRFVNVSAGMKSAPMIVGFALPVPAPLPATLATRGARLVRQDSPKGRASSILSSDWAFADCRTIPFPGTPDPRQLCLRRGFAADAAYTLTYQAKDPPVLGIGFAATRDLVAFLRSGKVDDAGAANPAGSAVRWTVGIGTSQSGNYLRSFLHLGFNADESGARVFDGINPNIAARQLPLNVRFGVPGGAADTYAPGSEGTLWWTRYNDRIRRRGTSSFLDRCTSSGTCPKIVETLGSAEFWGLRASPGFVGTDAKADLPLPANVRRYYSPGVTHTGGRGAGFSVMGDPAPYTCLLRGNANPSAATLRAAQQALVDWVKYGKEPPPSAYPTLAGGDLVRPNAKAMGWPAIPGAPLPDGHINALIDYDFGPILNTRDVSGVLTRQPPIVRRELPMLVPRVDADGNETAGIRSVQMQVPLGTYTGWNVEGKGFERGEVCGFNGGFIPFARTKAVRLASGDPRLSLEERYGDHAGFVARLRAVVAHDLAAGWLLADDAALILRDGEASAVLK